MLRLSLASLALVSALAVPARADELSVADANKLAAFFDKTVDLMVANKADCAKMTVALDAHITANVAMLRTVMKQVSAGKTLPKDIETRMTARMQKSMADLSTCAADANVNKAMARIENPDLPPVAATADVKPPVAADLETYSKKIAGKGDLIATITTSSGTIKCQLLGDKAPMTVANFIGLATGQKPWLDPKTNKVVKGKPYYNGTIFHRVIPEFMIQGGDIKGTGTGGPGYQFGDEQNDMKMAPGVLAMANAGPSTNGSQFFITDSTPSYLDGKHTIFGTCKPIEVVKKIAAVKRDSGDRPETAVKMTVKISKGTF